MIKILITGDFCPHKRIEQLVLKNKCERIYNDFLPYLEDNDVNITNLECPLINEKNPIPKVGPNLIAKEACIEALIYGKFNLVTLSNNHILDQGESGLLSTIQLCKKNKIEYIGAGRNLKEASKILIKEIKNKKIAFLNFSENEFSSAEIDLSGSNPLNPIKNYYSIKSAREQADYVIAIVHGGHEGYSLPSPRMVETYRFFVDAGADIVVGHHTHCFSGFEKYKEGYIFYSLGNFIFDWDTFRNSDWNYGYAVRFFFDNKEISFDIIPYKQCDKNPGVFLLNKMEKQDFDDKLKSLNKIIIEDNLLIKEWNIFSRKMRDSYLINFEACNSRIYKSLRHRNLIPGFLLKKKKLLLLNQIRCESHRDLSIACLKPEKK
jgi:poly-gamma-glutamate synthesis protein (capsule biosynthesis protein)